MGTETKNSTLTLYFKCYGSLSQEWLCVCVGELLEDYYENVLRTAKKQLKCHRLKIENMLMSMSKMLVDKDLCGIALMAILNKLATSPLYS